MRAYGHIVCESASKGCFRLFRMLPPIDLVAIGLAHLYPHMLLLKHLVSTGIKFGLDSTVSDFLF